jgi:hypothetical protein
MSALPNSARSEVPRGGIFVDGRAVLQGYLVLERGEHVLHNGERMARVTMRANILASSRASTSKARG